MNLKKVDQVRKRVVMTKELIDKMIEDFGPESTVTEADLLRMINEYRMCRSTLIRLKVPNPPRKK